MFVCFCFLFFFSFAGLCVAVGCVWSYLLARSVAALEALPLHGAGVLETETTTGGVAHHPDAGDLHVVVGQ